MASRGSIASRGRIVGALGATSLLAGAAGARADDDAARVVACRPTVTCTADLAPPGTLEVELGDQLRRSGGAFVDSTPLLVKLPLAPWIEAQLGTNGFTIADGARYVDNVVGGAKLHLADQTARRPSLAVTASISVPIWAQRGYVRAYDLAIVGHASKDLGPVHLDLNVGLVVDDLGGAREVQPWTALAATYAATSRLSVAIEPHAFADAGPFGPSDVGAIAAVEYAVRPWLVVDGAVDAVGVGDQRAVAAIAGVSFAPVRLF